jgi:hypothetical protein
VDSISKTNAVILLDMGHTKGRTCTGRVGEGREAKTPNVVDVLSV